MNAPARRPSRRTSTFGCLRAPGPAPEGHRGLQADPSDQPRSARALQPRRRPPHQARSHQRRPPGAGLPRAALRAPDRSRGPREHVSTPSSSMGRTSVRASDSVSCSARSVAARRPPRSSKRPATSSTPRDASKSGRASPSVWCFTARQTPRVAAPRGVLPRAQRRAQGAPQDSGLLQGQSEGRHHPRAPRDGLQGPRSATQDALRSEGGRAHPPGRGAPPRARRGLPARARTLADRPRGPRGFARSVDARVEASAVGSARAARARRARCAAGRRGRRGARRRHRGGHRRARRGRRARPAREPRGGLQPLQRPPKPATERSHASNSQEIPGAPRAPSVTVESDDSTTSRHSPATASQGLRSPFVPRTPEPPPVDRNANEAARLLGEAEIFMKYGLRSKAMAHITRAAELEPGSVDIHVRVRDFYVAMNDVGAVLRCSLRIAELLETVNPEAAGEAARALDIDGENPTARALYERLGGQAPRRSRSRARARSSTRARSSSTPRLRTSRCSRCPLRRRTTSRRATRSSRTTSPRSPRRATRTRSASRRSRPFTPTSSPRRRTRTTSRSSPW